MFVLGAGFYLPYAVLISAVDYWDTLFPDIDYEFYLVAIFTVANFFGVLFLIFTSPIVLVRIQIGLVIFTISFVLIPSIYFADVSEVGAELFRLLIQ